MPCTDGGYEHPSRVKDRNQLDITTRLDIATRLACEYCRQLEKAGKPIPLYADKWWSEHKKKDRLRKDELLKRKAEIEEELREL